MSFLQLPDTIVEILIHEDRLLGSHFMERSQNANYTIRGSQPLKTEPSQQTFRLNRIERLR